MQEFILTLLKTVGIQILGVFGIFFVFGYVLSFLQTKTHANYRRSIGWKGILFTAWIGTPIHEIGHVVFAKLFRHHIIKVSLFKPNKATGGLGHVEHEYNNRSLYQRIGNFFIGAAPMIFGGIALFLLLTFFLPNGRDIFGLVERVDYRHIQSVLQEAKDIFFTLFSQKNIASWQFWLFLYVSFCIVSHIAPSGADRKGMWHGFALILLFLILANIVALLLGKDITAVVLSVNAVLTPAITVFVYAIFLSLVHLLGSTILLYPFRRK